MHWFVVYLGRAAGSIAEKISANMRAVPQPRTSDLLWRVPYDNQSRAAGPVGIGHTPQQIASQYKEPLKALKRHFYQQNMLLVQVFITQTAMKSIVNTEPNQGYSPADSAGNK